jgi:hypothetical protein
MADVMIIEQEKARALVEAGDIIEGLLGEESPRIYSAMNDAYGRSDQAYVSAMIISELTRAVGRQDEQIADLKARVDELEA